MLNKFNKANRNKSTLQFTDLPYSSSPLAQSRQIYSYKSKIGQHMRDEARFSAKTETRTYDNKIFGSCKKYEVSIVDDQQKKEKTKDDYVEFYETKKTFVKPYAEMTKYTDLVSQNKSLVRRGIFNIPLKDPGVYLPKKKNISSRLTKYARTQKKMSQNYTTSEHRFIQSKKSSDLSRTFDRTISFHAESYRTLLSKQRSNKSECVVLSNNMNRVLAAQMINFKLRNLGIKNATSFDY